MTPAQAINYVKQAFLNVPLVHTVIDDFNYTSAYHDLKYAAVGLDIGLITRPDKHGMVQLSANIFVFDRLFDNPGDSTMVRSENNAFDLMSNCYMISETAFRSIENNHMSIIECVYQPFSADSKTRRQHFLDRCAGVIAQVTFSFPLTNCYDADFDKPINNE